MNAHLRTWFEDIARNYPARKTGIVWEPAPGGKPGCYTIDRDGEPWIYLDPALTLEGTLEVFIHELAHALQGKTVFEAGGLERTRTRGPGKPSRNRPAADPVEIEARQIADKIKGDIALMRGIFHAPKYKGAAGRLRALWELAELRRK